MNSTKNTPDARAIALAFENELDKANRMLALRIEKNKTTRLANIADYLAVAQRLNEFLATLPHIDLDCTPSFSLGHDSNDVSESPWAVLFHATYQLGAGPLVRGKETWLPFEKQLQAICPNSGMHQFMGRLYVWASFEANE